MPETFDVRIIAIVLVILGLALFAYRQHRGTAQDVAMAAAAVSNTSAEPAVRPARRQGRATPEPGSPYSCDGRRHCSQMTSCAEAKFFLKHCPNVEMDGEGDGVPCESQWCG